MRRSCRQLRLKIPLMKGIEGQAAHIWNGSPRDGYRSMKSRCLLPINTFALRAFSAATCAAVSWPLEET